MDEATELDDERDEGALAVGEARRVDYLVGCVEAGGRGVALVRGGPGEQGAGHGVDSLDVEKEDGLVGLGGDDADVGPVLGLDAWCRGEEFGHEWLC